LDDPRAAAYFYRRISEDTSKPAVFKTVVVFWEWRKLIAGRLRLSPKRHRHCYYQKCRPRATFGWASLFIRPNLTDKDTMRILISGGAGFLGSHLTDLLLSAGHDVVAIDNFITGKPQNISHLKGNPHYQFIRHDVIDPVKLPGPVDRIYHMASPASPIGYVKHQVATLKVNSQGRGIFLSWPTKRGLAF